MEAEDATQKAVEGDIADNGERVEDIEDGHEILVDDHTEETLTKDEEGGTEVSREEILRQYKETLEERYELQQTNRFLQAKLMAYFEEREYELPEELLNKSVSEQENEYQKRLSEVENISEEVQNLQAQFDKDSARLGEEFVFQEQEVKHLSSEFRDLRKAVTMRSVNSATGQRIPREKVDYYLKRLDQEDKLKREICLEYTKEKHALQKAENQKNELMTVKCAMNMNEYELMITETHIQNSKAEQNKKEVEKLSAFCWDAVNVITHLKHKLFFLRKDKYETRNKIKLLKEKVDNMTENLLQMKIHHEKTTKVESEGLRHKIVMMQGEDLPDDYEMKKHKYEDLLLELEKLKQTYADILSLSEGEK